MMKILLSFKYLDKLEEWSTLKEPGLPKHPMSEESFQTFLNNYSYGIVILISCIKYQPLIIMIVVCSNNCYGTIIFFNSHEIVYDLSNCTSKDVTMYTNFLKMVKLILSFLTNKMLKVYVILITKSLNLI